MKLVDLTIKQFLNEVDAPTPTPGGGSVSALAIAQGISLIRMVAHLTISKKKFLALDEKTKLDYMSRMSSLDSMKIKVLELVDHDTLAFNKIMDALKLPKNTVEEEKVRNDALNEATVYATEVPFESTNLAYKALEIAYPMFKYANKSATSDFGVGVMMINAGLIGAILNVRTNMVGFSDHEVSERFLKAVDEIEMKAKEIINKAITDVYTILK